MIGVAHREIQANHVVCHRHAGVERRRAGMVTPLRAHPGHACGFRFFNRALGGEFHHQMPHAVVAVDQCHRGSFALNADVRFDVHRAALDAAYVLRQTKNAVAFAAIHIGARHQLGDGLRFGWRDADRLKGIGDEGFKLGGAATCRRGG